MSEVTGPACSEKAQLAYVLMPFSPELRPVYETALKPAVVDAAKQLRSKIECRRSDETVGPGSITREVVGSIYRADVIIADLSGSNPNVFYELGVSHSLGNKTIMITQSIAGTPFDVAPYRLMRYEPAPSGLANLRTELRSAIIEVLVGAQGRRPSNPVQDFVPIPYFSVVTRMEDLLTVESCVRKDVWIIQPALETDLKFFTEVIRTNISDRSIRYRYLIPDTKTALRSVIRLRESLSVDERAWERVGVRVIEPHMVESEVVLYDPFSVQEQVFLMSCPEDESPFWYRVRGSRAAALRERFEVLWHDASRLAAYS